jgi:hypothetical protein
VIHRDLCFCRSRRYWLVTNGSCSFAESASIPAGQARVFWSAEFDPTVLTAQAERVDKSSAGIDFARLSDFTALLTGQIGQEHLLLSDGRQWLRIDILSGSVRRGPVKLHFLASEPDQIRQMACSAAILSGLFAHSRFPPLPPQHRSFVRRQIDCLRVYDALLANASQREIAIGLFGYDRVLAQWHGPSDAMRSQIRRLCKSARALAAGGYKALLRRSVS